MNGNYPIPGREQNFPIPAGRPTISPMPSDLQARGSQLASGMFRDNYGPPKMPAPAPSGPPPVVEPKPQERISMGQLNSTPDYVTKFLIDLARSALGIPGDSGGSRYSIPSPSQPSHGYNVAEGGRPEIVTAPGAYFPTEPGQVIPMEERQFGGEVNPSPLFPSPTIPNFQIPMYSRENGGQVTETNLPSIPVQGYRMPYKEPPGESFAEKEKRFGEWRTGEEAEWAKRIGRPTALASTPSIEMTKGPTGTFEAKSTLPPIPPGYTRTIGSEGYTDIPLAKLPESTLAGLPREEGYRERTRREFGNIPIPTESWRQYGGPESRISYRLGPENIAGDEAARQRILREAGDTSRYNIPSPGYGMTMRGTRGEDLGSTYYPSGRTYYDVHPEERYMDLATEANRPFMEERQKELDRLRSITQGFGVSIDPKIATAQRMQASKDLAALTAGGERLMTEGAKIPLEYYRYGMEYGPGSPTAQQRTAMAHYYESLAASEPEYRAAQIEHLNAQALKEGRQPLLHGTWGVFDPNNMKYYPAPNVDKTPHFEKMMTQIEHTGRYALTPQQGLAAIRNAVKAFKSKLSPEEYEGLPDEWKGEGSLSMPDVKTNKGRTIRDTETGKRYKSDGTNWTEIK